MPNRLAEETSPYLLQHAENPVDWYPWGDEAFARARDKDRPVLLSVGYSSCHWCHVMAHESFDDEATAALMNDWFVNIKVDREERPDVDAVYMSAVQAMTGQGGWPMTVFLTPDGKPFYSGTYFPPDDGHGRPGFPRVLEALHNAWTGERDKLLSSAEGIADHLRAAALRESAGRGTSPVDQALPSEAVAAMQASFDEAWGGFGGAPKFPSPGNLEFLLAHHARAGDRSAEPSALHMVITTLVRMAQGGMYDHLGGGFARYSVDSRWLVPHFEKMLYDNAQLARTYLHAFQLTQDPYFERIVRETLGFLEREMLDAEGGFYSALDADSEGIEGKFYVWTPAEIDEVLGEDGPLARDWFGVAPEGNFRDPHHPEFGSRTVLSTWSDPAEVASRHALDAEALFERLGPMKQRLLAARSGRVRPGLDDKVLTSWNGLALAAFAEAARVLGDAHYLELARRNAAFVRAQLWRDERLLHTYKGGVAKVPGLLEDYTFYGLGLVELYRATGDFEHLVWARELLQAVLERFPDRDKGGFFETPEDGEQLLLRPKPLFDGPTPSGNGAASVLALALGRYFGRADWEEVATHTLGLVGEMLLQAPTGFGSMLQVYEQLLAPRQELVVVGDTAARGPLERQAAMRFMPWLMLAPGPAGTPLPLFEGRDAGEQAQAFLCEDMVCQLPVSDPAALAGQLDAALPAQP